VTARRSRGAAPVGARRVALRGRLAGAALLLALAGCGGGGSSAVQEASLETRIAALDVEVKTRIGPAVCSIDSDCRALPMGALACGGPSEYLPYSIRGTDEGALTRLSADHQRLSAELNAQRQAVGNCIALAPPTPYCQTSAPLACKLR
jgi:hypothetical protein